MKTHGIALFLI